jgi:hypothetical protein
MASGAYCSAKRRRLCDPLRDMDVALGWKAHSGWAALVAVGRDRARGAVLVDRRRVELVEPGQSWAKQPYHAAEGLAREAAHDRVRRGIASAERIAAREIAAAVERGRSAGHAVRACAVLVGAGMPPWSVDEILAVHFRMHKAEGELFRGALVDGARRCGLAVVALPEKERARQATRLGDALAALGKSAGPPWGRDQKDAALAAWIALG